MIYDMKKIYSTKDFESVPHTQLMELYKNVKLMSEVLHGIKHIRKVLADLSMMRQVIKGFNQIHNHKEQL